MVFLNIVPVTRMYLERATAAAATMLARQLRNSAFISASSTRYLGMMIHVGILKEN